MGEKRLIPPLLLLDAYEMLLYSAVALTSPINIQRSDAVPVPNSNSNSKHLVELCVHTNTSEHHKLCLQ